MKKVLLSLVMCGLLLAMSGDAFACSCSFDSSSLLLSEKQQMIRARKRAKAVFSGEVTEIEIDEQTQTYKAKFKILKSWKKIESAEIVVAGTTMCCVCSFDFKVGMRYLVYANSYDPVNKTFGTNICTRTKALEDAKEDLNTLGKGKSLTKIKTSD